MTYYFSLLLYRIKKRKKGSYLLIRQPHLKNHFLSSTHPISHHKLWPIFDTAIGFVFMNLNNLFRSMKISFKNKYFLFISDRRYPNNIFLICLYFPQYFIIFKGVKRRNFRFAEMNNTSVKETFRFINIIKCWEKIDVNRGLITGQFWKCLLFNLLGYSYI